MASGVYANLVMSIQEAQKLYIQAKATLKKLLATDGVSSLLSNIDWLDDSEYHTTIAYSRRNFPVSNFVFSEIFDTISEPFVVDSFAVLNGGEEVCLVAKISDVRLQNIHNTLLGLGAEESHRTFCGHITLGTISSNADIIETRLKLAGNQDSKISVKFSGVNFENLDEDYSYQNGVKELFAARNEMEILSKK